MQPQVASKNTLSLPVIPEDKKKNVMGELGERCSNCSGLGFTNSIFGGSIQCRDCFQTGIKAPDVYEMQKTIIELQAQVAELKKL